jgi:hypothetical protein
MGASTQDMYNNLQAQLAMGQQQSLFGVTAPPNPQAIQTLLGQLRQQQYQQQANAPTPGPYGYLHDAGKLQMNSVGQQLGQIIGNAIPMTAPGAPAPQSAMQQLYGSPADQAQAGAPGASPNQAPGAAPTPQPGATPQQTITNQIIAAKAYNQSLIAQGVPADQAKVQTLQKMVQWGVPGAQDSLVTATADVLKNNETQSESAKNLSQAGMDSSDVQKNAIDNSAKQWKTTFTDPNGLYMLQTNGAGQVQRVELKPPPSAAAQAAANVDPTSLQFAADTYRTTGKFPGSFGKSPALQMAVLKQVAADAANSGDTAGSIAARTASLKAGGQALDQVTKQEAFTGSAVNTLDANLKALQTLGGKVDDTGSPLVNKVLNQFNQGMVSDPNTAAYVTMLNAVQGEYAKIASNNNGNSPISDAAKADAKDVINKAMAQGGVAAVAQVMRQESANRMQAIREAKQGLIGQLSGNAPGAPGGVQTPQPAGKVVDFGSLK